MLLFRPAPVDLVELRDGELKFLSKQKFAGGKPTSLRVVVGPGQIAEMKVIIESAVPAEQHRVLYTGKVVEGVSEDTEMGRAQRHELGLRVKSRRLKGFWGTSVDLSATGMQLEIRGPLERGDVIDLEIDFDRHDLSAFECEGEVMWCKPHETPREKLFRAGIKFVNVDPQTQKNLQKVADYFSERSHANLSNLLENAVRLRNESSAQRRVIPNKPAQKVQSKSYELPMDAWVTGYRWQYDECTVLMVLRQADGTEGGLEFPDCRTLRDYNCNSGAQARALETSVESELLHQLAPQGGCRHYRVLGPGEAVLLELISGPCRASE